MSVPSGRSRWLVGGLLLTLLAAWFAPPLEEESLVLGERRLAATSTEMAKASAGESPALATANSLDVLGIRERVPLSDEEEAVRGVFYVANQARVTEQVEAGKIEEVPPLPPQAPPLPFRFLGRYEDAGQSVVFLQYNDQSLVVRLGDTLGEQYKVEQIAGSNLELRYLPLNQIQSLGIASGR